MQVGNQAAYERVRAWFAGDHELARFKDAEGMTTCVYRGDNDRHSDLRCAFGVLIPDELYDPLMEGRNCHAVLEDAAFSGLAERFMNSSHSFLRDMQVLHDTEANDAEHLVELLDKLAREWGLTVVT